MQHIAVLEFEGRGISESEAGPLTDRYQSVPFKDLNETGYWWSSSESGNNKICYRALNYNSSKILRNNEFGDKENGLSIRCIKD